MPAMKRVLRWAAGTAASAVILYGVARASAMPLDVRGASSARLRLSWSARPERIEVCRTLSAEELAEREEHMRQRVECDGRFATYALRVDADGRTLHQSVVRGAGLRHDRPLYLLREIEVEPGVHRVRIAFDRREKADDDTAAYTRIGSSRADTGLFAGRAQREAEEHARRARAAIPPHLALDTVIAIRRGEVVVVSLDQERRVLHLLTDSSR